MFDETVRPRPGSELERREIGLDSQYAERIVARLLQPTLEHLRV